MEELNGPSEKDRNFVAEPTGDEQESQETAGGFVETAEMLELRQKIVEAGKESEQLEGLMNSWKLLAEAESDKVGGARPRIERMILEADLWEELGDEEYRAYCLEEAHLYADNEPGCEDLLAIVESKIG
jgi:hypothetical protein